MDYLALSVKRGDSVVGAGQGLLNGLLLYVGYSPEGPVFPASAPNTLDALQKIRSKAFVKEVSFGTCRGKGKKREIDRVVR